jgi:ABC-type multidrug transport system ATPase subunit
VLVARGLTREYGAVVAVNGIDLALEAGEFLTVFGPNGAGKTSLLRLLGGSLRPTSGEIVVGGERLDYRETGWRSRIGILSHQGYFYAHLTVEENLRFFGKLFGLRDLNERIPERLEQVGLADRAGFEARQLSHGMRQRLSLARALLHDPDLVLSTSPTRGSTRTRRRCSATS